MDSINAQQPEINHADLGGKKAKDQLIEMVKKAKSCFFCTGDQSATQGVRPMSVQQIDDDGILWFLSANDSHKNSEIKKDNRVTLYFQGSAHSDFLYLQGKVAVSEDKSKIDELWEPVLKTWFTEGKSDPRISVLRFTPSEGYYWNTKHGNFVAGIKMLLGAATGQTLDDSIEGRISPKG